MITRTARCLDYWVLEEFVKDLEKSDVVNGVKCK